MAGGKIVRTNQATVMEMEIWRLRVAHAAARDRNDKEAQERIAWAISFAIAGDKERAEPIYNQYVKEAT
ncbi:hypothetical protein [Burkholderia sp. BCC0405]|uniref:hypothetical protein n=1 Tax=Burkholderia sp. BCC0405 TaxID=2676298 RepID=UPI00158B156A|nr:hypothetical protein [Burkholderia sp. BCC0405]